MKTWRVILGLVCMTALCFGATFNVKAQPTWTFRPATNAPYAVLRNPALTNSPVVLATIQQVLLTTPPPLAVPAIATTNFGASGTYWTMTTAVPLPGDFFPDLPVYLLDSTNRTFLIDDRSVDYTTLNAQRAAENATNGSGGIMRANDLIIDTNKLWLSVDTNALPGSNMFNVVIHETVTGSYYDVLTRTDLLLPAWTVENTVIGATGDATPVTIIQNNRTDLFVSARESVIPIYTQPLAQEVFSGDSVTFTVGAGGSGLFYQWTFNGTNIFGATGSSYTIQNVNGNNIGDYACIVHNVAGSVTTEAATLTVDDGSGWPYDMSTVGQRQDYVFRSGVTYNITSPIQLFGHTKIEGGAIIKFDYNYSYPCLLVMGTLDCEGGAFNPAVLTSVDDDTFGATEQDSTGAPQPVFTGVPFLDLTYAGNVSLSNLRFRYADMAVGAPYLSRLDVWDCQFVQCYAGVVNEFGGTDGFHNVLFAGCYDAVAGDTNAYAVEMEQVTADVIKLWDSTASPSRLALTNSIVFGSIGSVSAYSAQSVTVAPDPANFQTNGAGKYYLAAASSLRQSGSTNISALLRAELKQKSTSPPLALPQLMNLTSDLTLTPQVLRYIGGAPDRGYYYAAVDYTVAFMTVFGNLTIEPGTTIAMRNEPIVGQGGYTYWGLDLRQNSSVVSHGLPNRPNIFTDAQTVQEQDEFACSSLFVPDFQGSSDDTAPVMDFRFSKLYTPAGGFAVWGGDWEFVNYGDSLASFNSLANWTMRDCEVHGGRISLGLPDIQIDLTQYYGAGVVDWENNLFENVNINLNPATYWYNGVVNFDESVTARNNLFKGANWMLLEPVPASAGNWTFTDNLFDGIDFQTDPAMPLNFDYNGYYPLPASQTLYNTLAYTLSLTAGDSTALFSATNDLGGLHEVFLNNALPYVSGAFGNYYLSTVTPLWQSGSRTAADAGLSQYTTFINQGKDSASQPVNIGLHYVAATNSLPLDSDGDGVPDFVEVEHGTAINNTMTDGITNDLYNPAYDDVDLSGSGLVGRIKKSLGLNPTNTSNPLNVAQISLDEETDIATIEIPINFDTVTNIGSLKLNLSGVSATMSGIERATNGNTLLYYATTFDAAEPTFLQAELKVESGFADETTTRSAYGPVLAFDADNLFQFFENNSMFDDSSAYLDAKVAAPGAEYAIELYDPSTTPPTFLFAITNTTSDGNIQEEWNLVCADSSTYTGTELEAKYILNPGTASRGGSPPKTPSRILTRATNSVSEWGPNFDVMYMYSPATHTFNSQFSKNGIFWNGIQGVVDILIAPRWSWSVYQSYFNRFLPDSSGEYPGYLTSMTDVNNKFLPDLTNGVTKNLFTYSHGSSASLMNADGDVRIYAADVQRRLGNSYDSKAKKFITPYPYRFVFLDGCETASDPAWRRTFGIYPNGVSSRGKVGPQAYVGWARPRTPYVNTEERMGGYTETLQAFYTFWMNGVPLAQCIRLTSDKKTYGCPLPVPGNEVVTQNQVKTTQLTSPVYVVGHSGLTVSGINSGFDNQYAEPKK